MHLGITSSSVICKAHATCLRLYFNQLLLFLQRISIAQPLEKHVLYKQKEKRRKEKKKPEMNFVGLQPLDFVQNISASNSEVPCLSFKTIHLGFPKQITSSLSFCAGFYITKLYVLLHSINSVVYRVVYRVCTHTLSFEMMPVQSTEFSEYF